MINFEMVYNQVITDTVTPTETAKFVSDQDRNILLIDVIAEDLGSGIAVLVIDYDNNQIEEKLNTEYQLELGSNYPLIFPTYGRSGTIKLLINNARVSIYKSLVSSNNFTNVLSGMYGSLGNEQSMVTENKVLYVGANRNTQQITGSDSQDVIATQRQGSITLPAKFWTSQGKSLNYKANYYFVTDAVTPSTTIQLQFQIEDLLLVSVILDITDINFGYIDVDLLVVCNEITDNIAQFHIGGKVFVVDTETDVTIMKALINNIDTITIDTTIPGDFKVFGNFSGDEVGDILYPRLSILTAIKV